MRRLCEACDLDCPHDPNGLTSDIEDLLVGPPPEFTYSPLFQLSDPAHLHTNYDKLPGSERFVQTMECGGRKILIVEPIALQLLAEIAFTEMHYYFRADHLAGWRAILDDPASSANERFVVKTLLQNACVAAGRVLPSCQDTGTAIVLGYRGECCWTGGSDEAALAAGVFQAYQRNALRYSQVAPRTMFDETNTGNNLPAQIDLFASPGNEYHFLCIAKGGGSANKSLFFQETKALLNPKSLRAFLTEKLRNLGTSACPPYHLAIVIGGTSAELTMKTVKLASCRYYDSLPTTGTPAGRAFRDLAWERIVLDIAAELGIGAQFGGRHFATQARVIRLPRHGASCPIGIGVSCSADRQTLARITSDGIFVERLVRDPRPYLAGYREEGDDDHANELEGTEAGANAQRTIHGSPNERTVASPGNQASLTRPRSQSRNGHARTKAPSQETVVVHIDLRQPMQRIRDTLSRYAVGTRVMLSGPLVVARDLAHARIQEALDKGDAMPEYLANFPVYYAGPAKTPPGYESGSFGPTTAGRMDSYVESFMAHGGSFVMLAKGNRGPGVTRACQTYKGFYLGSIGGPAAILAKDNITHVECIDFPELGMEAVWKIEVKDFPAFILVDDKGNDFYEQLAEKS